MIKITRVGLFGKFNDSSVADAVVAVKAILEDKNLSVLLGSSTSTEIPGTRIGDCDQPLEEAIDLAVVVGGDGTMLHVARELSNYGIPAIGVNLGRLGFLTDVALADLDSSMSSILQGDFAIEHRTMLQCRVTRGDATVCAGISLNDMVISKGNTGRLIEFEIWVNGQFVSQPRSDGLILATPTGSTAYALSAGGPIIYPNLPVISMSPICPHTLSNRPIILDEHAEIKIMALNSHETPANLAFDGVIVTRLKGDETITIKRAPKKLKMVRIDGFNYFETLHSKLGWNG